MNIVPTHILIAKCQSIGIRRSRTWYHDLMKNGIITPIPSAYGRKGDLFFDLDLSMNKIKTYLYDKRKITFNNYNTSRQNAGDAGRLVDSGS